MRSGAHVGIGVLSTGIVCWGLRQAGAPLDPTDVGLALGAAVVGSLAPDLDHPFSRASFGIPTVLLGYGGGFLLAAFLQSRMSGPQFLPLSALGPAYFKAAWTAVAVAVILLALSLVLGTLFGHRGPVHSIAFGVLASAGVAMAVVTLGAPLWLVVPFAWGWAAHLLADATTPMRVPRLLWPFDSMGAAALSPAPRTIAAPPQPLDGLATSNRDEEPTKATRIEAGSPPSVPVCPQCGVPMVARTARRGAKAGERFYGCVNFPRCRQTRAMS